MKVMQCRDQQTEEHRNTGGKLITGNKVKATNKNPENM